MNCNSKRVIIYSMNIILRFLCDTISRYSNPQYHGIESDDRGLAYAPDIEQKASQLSQSKNLNDLSVFIQESLSNIENNLSNTEALQDIMAAMEAIHIQNGSYNSLLTLQTEDECCLADKIKTTIQNNIENTEHGLATQILKIVTALSDERDTVVAKDYLNISLKN